MSVFGLGNFLKLKRVIKVRSVGGGDAKSVPFVLLCVRWLMCFSNFCVCVNCMVYVTLN